MAVSKVVLAKLSPTMEEGTIVKWNKKAGDIIKVGDVLAEIETDKANMEMESQGAGVLRKILVAAGGKAPIGTLIGVIAEPNEDIAPLIAKAGAAATTFSGCGRKAFSRVFAYGMGTSAEVTRSTGASRYSNALSEIRALISPPGPPVRVGSCRTITLPVFDAVARMASSSSGSSVRRSSTSTLMPSRAAASAASSATCIMAA